MMKKENDGASKKFENKTAGGKRRALKRAKKRKYGKGEAGKAKEAAEASIKFAEGNLDMMGASKKKPKGVKDADTEYMPVVDREKDAMKKGASMMKKKGASMAMKKDGSSMSGEKYDAKQAYNKNLSASARLHYLENNRADKKAKGKGHRSPIMKHMRGI
ncbi:hypothetical protein [uncultured virus]|uniref:Uncharacterized protein n=1 Tax=uncultured virus TaxID=340016 RepID=A0A218MLM1_9VIRU|nr:hypothetical protein [uncultured virus]